MPPNLSILWEGTPCQGMRDSAGCRGRFEHMAPPMVNAALQRRKSKEDRCQTVCRLTDGPSDCQLESVMVKQNTLQRELPLSLEDLHRIVHMDPSFQKNFQLERGDMKVQHIMFRMLMLPLLQPLLLLLLLWRLYWSLRCYRPPQVVVSDWTEENSVYSRWGEEMANPVATERS